MNIKDTIIILISIAIMCYICHKFNIKRKKAITLTDRGFKFLEKYRIILGFIDEFDL